MAVFVTNLLQQMQSKFEQMSDSILQRIDEMGARINELEGTVGELMQQAGVQQSDIPVLSQPPSAKPADS